METNTENKTTVEANSVLHTRYKKRQEKQKKLYIVILALSLAVIILAVTVIILLANRPKTPKEVIPEGIAQFDGKYSLDDYTGYEFDGAGKGALCLGEDTRYVFNYSLADNVVVFDYEDVSIPDVSYTYTFDGDNITITSAASVSYNLIKVK